jgi:hypothetical protein
VKRALLASVLALLGTAAAYTALGGLMALAGGWTRENGPTQVFGLALHATAVFARGVLPAVLLTSLACALAGRHLGRAPGRLGTLALAGLAAVTVFATVLTSSLGPDPATLARALRPAGPVVAPLLSAAAAPLRVHRAVDAVGTLVALSLAAAAAVALARRIVPARRAAVS